MSRLTTKQRRARERRRWVWPVPFSVQDQETGKALRPVQRRPRRRDEYAARGAVLTFDPRGKPLRVLIAYFPPRWESDMRVYGRSALVEG